MDKERGAGAVDSLGSRTLANALSQIKYDGAVAACGLAQGSDLPATAIVQIGDRGDQRGPDLATG